MPPRRPGGRRRLRRPRHRFFLFLSATIFLALASAAPSGAAEEEPVDSEPAEEENLGPPPAAGTTSVTQNLQGEGGIAVQTMCTNCNSADLSVGSFGNEHLSMTLADQPVFAGLAQIYVLSVLPPTVLDNVAVEAGAGRARQQGGAVGGAIEMQRAEIPKGIRLDASLDTGSYGWGGARVDLAGKVGWFGGGLAATWAESDVVDADQDGNPDMAAFDRTSLEARLEFEPARRHKLSLGGSDYEEDQRDGRAAYDFLSSGPRFNDRPTWNRENAEIDRRQYDLAYDGGFRDGSYLAVNVLQAQRSTEIEETDFYLFRPGWEPTFRPTYLIDQEQVYGSLGWSRPVGLRTMLRAGLSASENRYDVIDRRNNEFNPEVPDGFVQEETQTENGFWAEGEFTLGGNTDLFVGVRRAEFEYTDNEFREYFLDYDLPEGSAWLPRTALIWKPVNPLTLRFSAGKGLRQPPATYEKVCCGRTFRGNRGVRMEYSTVWGLEATWQPVPDLKLKASAFRSKFEDLVVNMVSEVFVSRPTYQNVNLVAARTESFSVEASFNINWFTIRTSAGKTDARNESPNDEIIALVDTGSPPLVEHTYHTPVVPYVPERNGSISLQARWNEVGMTIDASAQYKGSMVIQAWDSSRVDPIDGSNPLYFVSTPSFWVTNARLTQRLPKGIQIFLGVDNIGDYFQPDLANPDTDYTWGPLRGTYYYYGLSYSLDRRMGS